MPKTFLTAVFLLLSISSFAQKIRFTDTANQWSCYRYDCYHDGGLLATASTIGYTGDTIIHSMTYRKMPGFSAFIREDTLAGKVYVRNGYDTSEYLLYDYTLKAGDTFKVYNGAAFNEATSYVSVLDSVLINSIWYKTWHFILAYGTIPGFGDFDVIEGIGSLFTPVAPVFPPSAESCTSLTCFNYRGTTPVISAKVGGYFDNVSSCSSLAFLGTPNNTVDKDRPSYVMPNPLTETSEIVFPSNISSGSMAVINEIGQTIINTSFQNKDRLLIGDNIHNSGIYCYRVTDNQSGKVFTGKFVRQ